MNNNTPESTPDPATPSEPPPPQMAEDILRESLRGSRRRRGTKASQETPPRALPPMPASTMPASTAPRPLIHPTRAAVPPSASGADPAPDAPAFPIGDAGGDAAGAPAPAAAALPPAPSHVSEGASGVSEAAPAAAVTNPEENRIERTGEDAVAALGASAVATGEISKHLLSRKERSQRARDAAAPAAPRRSLPTPLIAVGMLVVGLVCGVLLMRQRRAAQEVVVSVNGSLLKQDEMNRRIQSVAAPPVARKWVQEELWLQFARQQRALPTQAEVDSRYARLIRDPEFATAQQAGDKSPQELKRALQVQMAQAALLSRNAQADEAEARAFYAQNSDPKEPGARYFVPETLEAQIIVMRTREVSDKALQRLKRGESFERVAREMSVDTSSQNGGKVTIQRHRGRYTAVPGMEQTLFGLEPGENTDPHEFAGYWWITRCVSKKPEHVLPYEQVAEDCRLGARLKKGVPQNSAQVQADFAAFQKTARVEAFWPGALQAGGNP